MTTMLKPELKMVTVKIKCRLVDKMRFDNLRAGEDIKASTHKTGD